MVKNKLTFLRKNFDHLLIFSGIFLITIFIFWRYYQVRILSFYKSQIEVNQTEFSFLPKHIKSYPVGVDIDIRESAIINGVWPVFPDSAGYIINGKNLIIYGHNKNNIFGPIRWMKEGSEIEILSLDNQKIKFKVIQVDSVDPDNLKYIQKSEEEILTLYTCTGFLDSKRFIVVAKRI